MASPTYPGFKSNQVQSSADREVCGNVKGELKPSNVLEDHNKMYSCEVCEMKTECKSNFVRHLRKQHGNFIDIKSPNK